MSKANEVAKSLAGEGDTSNVTPTDESSAETKDSDSSPPVSTETSEPKTPAPTEAAAVNGHAEPAKEGDGDDSKANSEAKPKMNGTCDDTEKHESGEETSQKTETTVKTSLGNDGPAAIYKVTSPELSNKASIRRVTWQYLDSSGLVYFPRPCMFRIPRFKGENEAVEKLASLDVFKNAKIVKTNLDKSHERLRFEVIQSGKEFVVGAPGLREAVFYHMRPPMGSDEWRNHVAASRLGITSLASALIFNSGTKADLIVVGSVAVDRKGRRVGKGDGFSDLEFALLSALGCITPDATIVTLVHDAQVFEELPDSIFKNHDVPVDIIVTPTQVINVATRLPRPTLQWELLSLNRINEIPILKLLLDVEKTKGRSVALKSNDPPTPIPPLLPRRKFYRNSRRQTFFGNPRDPFMPFVRTSPSMNRAWPRGKTFTFNPRQLRRLPMMDGNHLHHFSQPHQNQLHQQSCNRYPRPRQNSANARSHGRNDVIRVKGLNASVRIRDLKAALYTRGVRPSGISWRPKNGLAILYFNTEVSSPMKMNSASQGSADELVTMLKGLSVCADDGSVMKLDFEATNASQN